MGIKPELDQLGVSLVAVGARELASSPKKFKLDRSFEGSVFIDEVGRLLLLSISQLKCVGQQKGLSFKEMKMPKLSVFQQASRFVMSMSVISLFWKWLPLYPSSGNDGAGMNAQVITSSQSGGANVF